MSETILREHLALSVAAHITRSQLVPDPLNIYDAQHLGEMLNAVGRGLAKTSPLYVRDADGERPRQLTIHELEGVIVRRGASVLELKDGRSFCNVTIRRGDLRQAIALLRTVGIPELPARRVAEAPPSGAPADAARDGLLKQLDEIEALLHPPLQRAHIDEANRLTIAIARTAANGRISNLAMQLISSLLEPNAAVDEVPGGHRLHFARLRAAIQGQSATDTNP